MSQIIVNKPKLRAFDLFSGIGGFRAGAESQKVKKLVEIDFIGFSEIDKYAVKTYTANFDTKYEKFVDNIEKVTKLEENEVLEEATPVNAERMIKINSHIPDFDILFAGFPCQSHSLMGNRKGVEDDRGELFYSIREILRAKQPRFIVLENVRAIKSVNEGRFFAYIKDCLENELGYNLTILDINSSDFGVPQTRRRTFFVGVLNPPNEYFLDYPLSIDPNERLYATTWHLLEREVEAKYYLSEKIKKTILLDEKKGYKRRAEINKLVARPLTKTMHKMHRASQDNYYSDDFINGKFDGNLGVVIPALTGSESIRRITPLEAFRIQGFKDEFVFNAKAAGVSDTRLYMQAGNAVTVTVIESLLESLFIAFIGKDNKSKEKKKVWHRQTI